MSDAANGIGKSKYAWNALKIGSSTPPEFVFQFLTSAPPTIEAMETASPAIKVTPWTKENANWPLNKKSLTSVVLNGTGITKYAWNAHTDGSLTKIKSASQLLIHALFITLLEPVLVVTMVTFSINKDNASKEILCADKLYQAVPVLHATLATS